MFKLTRAHACAFLLTMITCVLLTAQAQDAPPADNKWPMSKPYIVFYEEPPTPIDSKNPIQHHILDPSGFTTSSRYILTPPVETPPKPPVETPLEKLLKTIFDFELPPLSVVPNSVTLSTQLATQEALVERLYVPIFEDRKLLAPDYGIYMSDKSGVDIRFKIFADARLIGSDADAIYYSRLCTAPSGEILSYISVNPEMMINLEDIGKQFYLRQTIAHELLHGSRATIASLCKQKQWIFEGGPEGYAKDASWRSELTKNLVEEITNAGQNPFYSPRKYYLPLDLDLNDISKFAQAGGTGIKNKQDSKDKKDIKDKDAIPIKTAFNEATQESYATSSYFEYLLAAQLSGELARNLFYSKGDRKELYQLIQSKLDKEKLVNGKVEKVIQEFPQHLAKFYTEYASWGGGRYKQMVENYDDDSKLVFTTKDKKSEDLFRNKWLTETFACDAKTDIELTENNKSARSSVLLKNLAPLSGRCFRIKWKNITPAANLKIQLLVQTDKEAESLNLGLAYFSGAAHNGSDNHYCYQHVTEGGGTYGEPIVNDRIFADPVDACLFRESSIEDVEYEGKKYRALTFATKYTAGKDAGEAVFIVTNAAKKADKNTMFDVRPLIIQNRIAIKMDSGRTFASDEPQVSEMVVNHSDAYIGGIVKLSRDVKIDTADMNDAVGSMPNFDNAAAMTVLSTGDFIFNIADAKDGVSAALMSSDMRLISASSATGNGATGNLEFIEECGLVNELKVEKRSLSGFELTYVADMIDLHKLVNSLMQSPKDVDCEAVRSAIVDRATVEVYLPDGRMHMYDADIARVFPPDYDDAVARSLSPRGIADNGGLPRRKDLSTFLTGMPGTIPTGGSPSFPGDLSEPMGDTPDSPIFGADTDWGSVTDEKCTAQETLTFISQLDTIATPCNCSCASLERDRTLFQEVMMNSIKVMSGTEACIEAASSAMGSAGERMSICMSETCISTLSEC